jgi:hypothetical protein
MIMLANGDNEDSKGKFNKGKRRDYSEQLFLTHSFHPSTGSQYHVRWVRLGRVLGLGRVAQLGHWVGLGHWASQVELGPVQLG